MSKKPNETRSYLPAQGGGVAPAPAKRNKPARAGAAPAAPSARPSVNSASAGPAPANGKDKQEIPRTDNSSEQEEIARLAYLLWEARGGSGGSPEEDWLQAEEQYRKRSTR